MRYGLIESKFPNTWHFAPLSEVGVVQTGIAKGGKSAPDEIDLPYLRVANVQSGKLDLTTIKTIQVCRQKADKYRLQYGDVLLTEGGDFDKLGRGTIWRDEIPGCIHQNHIFVVRCDKEKVLPEWLSLVCESQLGRRYFGLCSKQTTNLASINSTQLKAFPVPVLSMNEQVQIVGLLTVFDNTIQTTDALLAAKREQKRGLMQELLTGRLRFCEFGGDWVHCTLGDLGKVKSGGTPSKSIKEFWSGDIPWCTPTDITGLTSRHISRTLDTISEAGLGSSSAELLPAGTVVVCTRATVGIAGISSMPLATNQGFKSIIPQHPDDSDFIYYLIGILGREFHRQAAGSTFVEISGSNFSKIPCCIPPERGERKKIATTLTALDAEITHLQSQADQLREQKRGLMQRIFSGDLDLSRLKGSENEVSA